MKKVNIKNLIYSENISADRRHRIIKILGIKLKFRRKYLTQTELSIPFVEKCKVGKHFIIKTRIPEGSEIGEYATIGDAYFYGKVKMGNWVGIASTARIGACNHPIYHLSGQAIAYVSNNIFDNEDYKYIRERNKMNSEVAKFKASQRIDDKWYCVIGSDVYIGANAVIMGGG